MGTRDDDPEAVQSEEAVASEDAGSLEDAGSFEEAVSLEALAASSGCPVGEVLLVVVEAVAAGLLDAGGTHLRPTSAQARRQLEARLTAGPAVPARHDAAAGPDAAAGGPLEWLRWTAGRVATDAPDTAVELLRAALPFAQGLDRPGLVADLAVALHAAGRHDDVAALCRLALRQAAPGAEVLLRRILVDSLLMQRLLDEAGLEAAHAAACAPAGARSWFLAAQALVPLGARRPERAEQLAVTAQRAAEEEGDDRALALALRARVLAAGQAGRHAEGARLADHLVAVCHRVEAHRLEPLYAEPEPRLAAAAAFSDVDRHVDAMAQVRIASRLARASARPAAIRASLARRGTLRAWEGDWDRAVDDLRDAVGEGHGDGDADGDQLDGAADLRALLAVLCTCRGETTLASVMAREAEDAARSEPSEGVRLGWMRAELSLAGGSRDQALAHLAAAWCAASTAPGERRRIGPLLVRLAVADPAAAVDVAGVIDELDAGALANRDVPGLAGVAAWAAGLGAGDGTRVAYALQLIRRSGRVHDVARCAFDAAMLLAGEHATAAPLAEEALGAFDRLGAVAERDRAMAELGGTGLVPSMRRRVAADAGWASLTDSERRVAVLLADGLSNPEIAGRLFVAPRTVSTHVSHILRKLGLRSRTEVAVMVARQAARDHGHPMTERQY